jgi:Fe-S-cluster-containing dehydrogenase component
VHEGAETPPKGLTLYPEWKYEGYAWGMAIDLNACTGCGACVVACQAENNIAVVGKDQVRRGRAMHWLRVDSYYRATRTIRNLQPAGPLHALRERALRAGLPGAGHHAQRRRPQRHGLQPLRGHALLLQQLPYKVRRFNFYLFSDFETPSLKLLRNPDVTVRSRGVMEKCTYCVQRINAAKIDAEKQDRPVRDGEIQTACQATCPAEAIVFGDINDPNSRVSKMKANEKRTTAAGRSEHAAADHVSGDAAQSQFGDRGISHGG